MQGGDLDRELLLRREITVTKTTKKKCCDGVQKKCFKCQLEALSDSYEARRVAMSRDLMNTLVADEIVEACRESATPPIIMLQDYHLYLCAGLIRHH